MEHPAESAPSPGAARGWPGRPGRPGGSGWPERSEGEPTPPAPDGGGRCVHAGLRRCVLSAAVIDDVDIFPQEHEADGLTLRGVPVAHGRSHPPVTLTWPQVAEVIRGLDPDSTQARHRLGRWLSQVWWLAELPEEMLRDAARLVGLPAGHVLHPGRDWPVGHVLGGAVEVGFGVAELDPARAGEVVVVSPAAVRAAGLDSRGWLAPAAERLRRLSELAAQRLRRDRDSPVTPYGGADALTLLAGRALRAQLTGREGDGLALVAAPARTRAWTRLSSIDPTYIPLAYAATEPALRGFPAALLVSADEVVLARAGQQAGVALRDAGPQEPRQIILRG